MSNYARNNKLPENRHTLIEDLVDTNSTEDVLEEVVLTVSMFYPGFNFSQIISVFDDVTKAYEGRYPGLKACNTGYHDLKHTTDVFLAMAAALNGINRLGKPLSFDTVRLGLIGALMHDIGYLQEANDHVGTGAKHTEKHVLRSIDFIEGYFREKGYPAHEFTRCANMVTATDLSVNLNDIVFKSDEDLAVGQCLFTADIMGQMADRLYLEKLLLLYQEFSEAGIPGYCSEDELLFKTLDFSALMEDRLRSDCGYSMAALSEHFQVRWDMDMDLYSLGSAKNRLYLKKVLSLSDGGYRNSLKRGGVVEALEQAGIHQN